MNNPVKTGLIGCGKISDAYFEGARRFEILQMVACADLDGARARDKAAQQRVRACTPDELLADPEIDIVVNLTVPQAHVEINARALRAGKNVYTEKPFALTADDSAGVLALAREAGRLVGSAPDTFLGGGQQTARHLIDAGAIGRPVAALAFMLGHGPEAWHPNPEFFYKKGGGPMWDMGPYYITALVNLLGPVARVSGAAGISFPERVIGSQPFAGQKILVEVPTHVTGVIEFASGATATAVISFDVWPGPALPPITVFGAEGTMEVPDPNRFDGTVRVRRMGEENYTDHEPTHTTERGRGTGVADMAYALRRPGRGHRASGALAHHVVEVMEAFEKSAASGRRIDITSTCERPAPLPAGLAANELDA